MLVRLKLLTSGDSPALASQSAGITGMSHHTWPKQDINLNVAVVSFHYHNVSDNQSVKKPLLTFSHRRPEAS